ncbi:MAG: FRG domain-containing protein [Verrucomicrobiae bacterium]|nr:FRG domain-containing protein [Verrucomicrobiae bacterium]
MGRQELWSFFDDQKEVQKVETITEVREAEGHRVTSYLELATKIAELQFRNREHVLMFRGQGSDHRNSSKSTTLKPSLFRPQPGGPALPGSDTLTTRFETLKMAERQLIRKYENADMLDVERLKRHRILRWAILQHYEVCPTPLLDVTHSLRIAASFASQDAAEDVFLFVLAVPNLSGAVTASAETGLQIVRLSSVCPPAAVRPHIQEGYLLGEYPEMADYGQKELYGHYEIDFARRLLAKFRFDPKTFWKGDTFPQVGKLALYPSKKRDPLLKLTEDIKAIIRTN